MDVFGLLYSFGDRLGEVFSEPLAKIFHPTNVALASVNAPVVWKICAIGLFGLAMLWVYTLKNEYVNMSAPSKHFWWDLRLWTVVCMLPHVIIYLWLGT